MLFKFCYNQEETNPVKMKKPSGSGLCRCYSGSNFSLGSTHKLKQEKAMSCTSRFARIYLADGPGWLIQYSPVSQIDWPTVELKIDCQHLAKNLYIYTGDLTPLSLLPYPEDLGPLLGLTDTTEPQVTWGSYTWPWCHITCAGLSAMYKWASRREWFVPNTLYQNNTHTSLG